MNENKTVMEILDSLTDKQRAYVYRKIGLILDGSLSLVSAINYIRRRPDFTNEQKEVIICILKESAKDNKEAKGDIR